MSKWILKRKGADFEALSREYGLDPLIVRLMVNRQVEDISAYMNGGRECFNNPAKLKDLEKAASIIKNKILEGKSIRIIGDYDVDGVCSVAILLKGLKKLNANVDYYIPHRFKDGYGLNLNIIDKAHDDGIDTILTCDNGISAVCQVDKAIEYGMTVVITDHHEVPFTEENGKKTFVIPNAHAIVDPKQEDCKYPFKNICGAFVSYKLIQYLLGDEANELLDELLQYAALATVADVMELQGENRALVREGMKLMSENPPLGLKALMDLSDISGRTINIFHLGFIIGPSINAAGRLSVADEALDLLMCDKTYEAMQYAGNLRALNDNRKTYTERCTAEAVSIIENSDIKNDKVIVVNINDCHEGVIGIVAGRLKEKYNRPVFAVTDTGNGLKGSGRSVSAYNMYEEMSKVRECFTKFGGHSQAAGFSLDAGMLDELRNKLNANCNLSFDELMESITIDADMPFSYCTGDVLNQMEILEPCGQGNPRPLFARKNLKLLSAKLMGRDGKVGKYKIVDTDGYVAELTLFNRNEELKKMLTERYGDDATSALYKGQATTEMCLAAAYYPKWNEYNQVRTIQFVVEDFC